MGVLSKSSIIIWVTDLNACLVLYPIGLLTVVSSTITFRVMNEDKSPQTKAVVESTC